MVDSISHGVLGIEEVKQPGGKLESIQTSSIPMHKVMIIAGRKTECASKFMDWGESIYPKEECDHLCQAFIDPRKDFQCTGEEESLYLADSHSADTSIVSNDLMNHLDHMISDSENDDLGTIVMDHN